MGRLGSNRKTHFQDTANLAGYATIRVAIAKLAGPAVDPPEAAEYLLVELTMSPLLTWPDDFGVPKPVTDFDLALLALFDRMTASGTTVYADDNWSLFGFRRGSRCIEFIRRGRLRRISGQVQTDRETYWEVLPMSNNLAHRLGPLFGIREYGCVVISGITAITSVTTRWLDGMPLAATVLGITFWDRSDPSSPLEAMA